MKKTLFPVVAFILSTLGASGVNAAPVPGSKRPGPSAVQAARLKKYPAPSYLSHYLPDDRYKIAGGVWKYVSTDLDTYYHIASSPNMLRQPANRVIGFANARDAEEAGYVADPTDGTATAATPRINSVPSYAKGFSAEEVRYLDQYVLVFGKSEMSFQNMYKKYLEFSKSSRDSRSTANFTETLKEFLKQQKAGIQATATGLKRLNPPPRLRKYHQLTESSVNSLLKLSTLMENTLGQGDLSGLAAIDAEAKRAQTYAKLAHEEAQRLQK
ncbi:hypothetical protein EON83_22105 [bacterium]|nr:MAG: hypothetical protein EON83_22105 [bacterium]